MGVRARSLLDPSFAIRASLAGSSTVGRRAAEAWLHASSLTVPPLSPWHAEITLGPEATTPAKEIDDTRQTRLRIEIYSEEWGFFFCHRGYASWIRVTDIAFVHGRDDFRLLAVTPTLDQLGSLVQRIERLHHLAFAREHALVRTNIPGAEPAIRRWVAGL